MDGVFDDCMVNLFPIVTEIMNDASIPTPSRARDECFKYCLDVAEEFDGDLEPYELLQMVTGFYRGYKQGLKRAILEGHKRLGWDITPAWDQLGLKGAIKSTIKRYALRLNILFII